MIKVKGRISNLVVRLIKRLRFSGFLVFFPILGVQASSNWDRMSWDWDVWYQMVFTAAELDEAILKVEDAKNRIIEEKDSIIVELDNSLKDLSEEKNQIIDLKEEVIRDLSEVVHALPQGNSSLWDTMVWDENDWFIDVGSLATPEEVSQILGESLAQLTAEKDAIIFQKDEELFDFSQTIATQDIVINELNEIIEELPQGKTSIWDEMIWDQDQWFAEFEAIASREELREFVIKAENLEKPVSYVFVDIFDIIENEKDSITAAITDKDGDGLTDEQEIARGMDPNKYELILAKGWNLVSLARIPEDNKIQSIVGNNVHHNVWVWEDNLFRVATEFLPSRGHWVYAPGQIELEIELQQ